MRSKGELRKGSPFLVGGIGYELYIGRFLLFYGWGVFGCIGVGVFGIA